MAHDADELPTRPRQLPRRADPLELALARERTRASLIGHTGARALLGRYQLRERLGEGGMGTVYAAVDPVLGRRVAIKLVRTRGLEEREIQRFEDRLLREAHALAQLADPSILPVFEVGRAPAGLFVVMELVDGVTLRRWVHDARPQWREIVDVLIETGRALAVAHAAGLVHRDVKPDNVMIAHSPGATRIRLLDFGLAAAAGEAVADALVTTSHGTRTTAGVVGTPAYMAPEQVIGERPDARADQFAFCVTAFELLFGRRPFVGQTPAAAAIAGVSPRPPSRWSSDVPARVTRVVLRGLAFAPAERHRDMHALVAALERARAPRRLAWLALAGVVGTAALMIGERGSSAVPRCVAALRSPWDTAAREQLARSFAASEVPFAEAAARTVTDDLERWSVDWRSAGEEACAAAPTLRDARLACLEREAGTVAGLLAVLDESDGDVIARAPAQTQQLADPHRCLREPANARSSDPARTAIREQLDRAHAALQLGRFSDGELIVEPALRDATLADDPELIAEALEVRGALRLRLGRRSEARDDLEQSYWLALPRARVETAIEAALQLAAAYDRGKDSERSLAWVRHAWAHAIASSAPTGVLARVLGVHAMTLEGSGRIGEAVLLFGAAVVLVEDTPGCTGDCGDASVTSFNFGLTLVELGRVDEGERWLRRAHELALARLGPDHPSIATDLHTLARVAHGAGRLAEAHEGFTRALAIRERALGPDHPELANTLVSLAGVELDLGAPDQAERWLSRAIAIGERRQLGDAAIATFVAQLANVASARGHFAEAVEHNRRAYGLYLGSLGEHNRTATTLLNWANALADLGEYAEAEAKYRESIAMRERASGPDDPELGLSLENLGALLVDLGRAAEAIPLLERALALAGGADDPRGHDAAFHLARASAAVRASTRN